MRPFHKSIIKQITGATKGRPVRRRGWDSNPRWLITRPLFESGTINHSDTSPTTVYQIGRGIFDRSMSHEDRIRNARFRADRGPVR
jgi:hypothetical protein